MRFLPLTVLTALSTFFSVPDDHAQLITTPLSCLNPPTRLLEDVIGCLHAFTIPENTYPCSGSGPRQPNTLELKAWNAMFRSLLDVDGDCTSFSLHEAIAPFYTVNHYTEPGPTGRSFCRYATPLCTGLGTGGSACAVDFLERHQAKTYSVRLAVFIPWCLSSCYSGARGR